MSKNFETQTCSICGKEKKCTCVSFIPVAGKDEIMILKPYNGARGVYVPGELSLAACGDCGKRNGKAPVKAWVTLLIACVLIIVGGIFTGQAASGNGSVAIYASLISVGAITMVAAAFILVFKARHEMNGAGMFFALFFSFFPPINLLILAIMAKKINRCARARAALKAEAERIRRTEREKDEAIAKLEQSNHPLTEEELEAIEERKRRKEAAELEAEYAREEQREKQKKSNTISAVIGILFTIVIAIRGAGVYSSGRGYMTFLGIELSPGGFAALIGAFVIWDILSIVSAIKRK